MKNYELSDTYKFLYDYILGHLISQVCRNTNFCVRNKRIPYIIGQKFERFRQSSLKNMSGKRLDRHKLASCICGAVIEAKPLVGFNHKKIPGNTNEVLALYAGLTVIKYYMVYDATNKLNTSDNIRKNISNNLLEIFKINFPSADENICDTQDYQTNLINSLYWTHYKCDRVQIECFHFDVWAYSKIFYHLELYNKENFRRCFDTCNQTN